MIAKYHGDCANECGTRVHPGDEIQWIYNVDGPGTSAVAHLHCPTSKTDLDVPRGTELCSSCFTYHNGECA